jgi:ABC-type amino acid transport substrate-binding protein
MSARLGLLHLLALAACGTADAQPKPAPQKSAPADALYDVDTAAQPAPKAGQSLAGILKSLHVRVCVRSDVPPFSYFGQGGLQGFDVALAQELVDHLSIDYKQALKPEWVVVTAADRMKRLQDSACDLVVASFSYTKERATQVATSKVYVRTDKVLVGSAKITRGTPIVAKLEGATGDSGIKGAREVSFKTYLDIVHAMDMDEIDYVVTDRPIGEHLIRSSVKSFKVTKTLAENAESYVVAVNKDANHTELLAAIDRALVDLAQTGRLALLERRWL